MSSSAAFALYFVDRAPARDRIRLTTSSKEARARSRSRSVPDQKRGSVSGIGMEQDTNEPDQFDDLGIVPLVLLKLDRCRQCSGGPLDVPERRLQAIDGRTEALSPGWVPSPLPDTS